MKKFFPIFSLALLFSLVWFSPAQLSAATAMDPCGLYTKTDAEALFNEAVSDGVSRKASFPAGATCRYTFTRNGSSYGLKLRISDDAAIKEEGIQESAADVMERQKKARRNNANAAKNFQEIPNLGDDAFWNGTDLWFLKGATLVIISVNSPLEGSFQNMEAMNKARGEQDLGLSLKVAETVLSRLQ